jgi:predicted CoA-substrate-specific enzyme activase
MSDVSCHGKGVHYFFPEVRTIIELGGQSSKVIRVDERGKAIDFVISEKCAAGSGRFLQLMSKVLRIGFEDIGPLSMESKKAVEFSTGCAVFAESEAISRISEGACKEDILAGVHQAIAMKIINLLERIGSEGEIAITGGGAKDVGLIMTLEEKIGTKLLIPQDPLLTAALGAAIIAQERLLSS